MSPTAASYLVGQHRLHRRHFLRGAAATAGLAFGSGLVLPTLAFADNSRQPVAPVPVPGGDVLGPPDFPPVLVHQFLPGSGAGFDGINAELNGITNFQGLATLGYTSGTAIDSRGRTYNVQTDIRGYQGDYVGADGTHADGTFVEI
jgi:hypothetical protein